MWLKTGGRDRCPRMPGQVPSHAGLGYTRCAPLDVLKEDPRDREQWLKSRGAWLDSLTRCPPPTDYLRIYLRLKQSFQRPDLRCFLVRAVGRILIGHGTSSATGVGLTLHSTYGVPVLPGSSLKGLTAHFVQTVYGPDPGTVDPEREPFRGPVWQDNRLVKSPGEFYQRLFGAPDVEGDDGSQGGVIFHDALWVPAPGPMLMRDVLTVHQRAYYESAGATWPVDYDDPNPVSFLTVAPGHHFLVALEAKGQRELLERAERYLCEALATWGVGGKTVAGYGRLVREEIGLETPMRSGPPPPTRSPVPPVLKALSAWLKEQKAQGVRQKQQFEQVKGDWAPRLMALHRPERDEAVRLLKKFLNFRHGDEKKRMDELLESLRAE